MNIKHSLYAVTAAAAMFCAAGCEHSEIYEPLEFSVRLSPDNTYIVGEPVVFDFDGNADYISVWTGDTGHEYRFRNRTTVAMEDLVSCELSFGLAQAYGATDTENRYMDILVSKNFGDGLTGSDAEADRAKVEAIGADHAGWDELYYENMSNRVSLGSVPKVLCSYDITEYADNFALALHLHHPEGVNMRSFAFNEFKINVQFNGYDPVEYYYEDLWFTPFSTISQHADNPYVHNISGNGYIKLQGEAGSNGAGEIVFQGYNAADIPYVCDQWLFLHPMPLNRISPDTGLNIKGIADDLPSYSCTYDKAGTYTATFLAGTGNYQGASGTKLYEVTFTVIEPVR